MDFDRPDDPYAAPGHDDPDPVGRGGLARRLVLLGGAGLLLVVGATKGPVHDPDPRRAHARTASGAPGSLEARVADWASLDGLREHVGPPWARERLVVVDARARTLDPLHAELPPRRAARDAGEAGTIVLVRRGWTRVGATDDGVALYGGEARVTVVDRREGLVVARRRFPGDEALPSPVGGRDLEPPPGPVLDWILSLPRR